MQTSSLWSVKPDFRAKVSLLALTFGFLTGAQALWRPLKASIFAKIVGAAYVADAKVYSIFLLIPFILLYSRLVDVLRRHQLVHVFTLFHAVGGLLFAYYLADPVMGLANTDPSGNRWIGWAFYMFMESFSAFLATAFWGFANSINKPQDARNYYGLFVAGSKMGGIFAAASMWLFMTVGMDAASAWLSPVGETICDTSLLCIIMVAGSAFLFLASITIWLLMKVVPGYLMHGYEAVYQLEKKRSKEDDKEEKQQTLWEKLKGSMDGLWVILTQPYVLGIFFIAMFHDIMITILDLSLLVAADKSHATVGALALYYAKYFFSMHSVGLLISVFGTTPIQRYLTSRAALLVYPLTCMAVVIISFFFPAANILFASLVIVRAANYGLNHPIRETLYIPTTKEIKFKSKAWTDAFGTRIAKGTGSVFYKKTAALGAAAAHSITSAALFTMTGVWLVISYFLGRTLQKAIDKKHIIGEEGEQTVKQALASDKANS
jgi:AAA family ATP:ADP antiporter